MNNRDYKNFGREQYYHIFNRGNRKADIFIDNSDYQFFLLRLKQNLFPEEDKKVRLRPLPVNSFSLISYCLMPNHFHFLIRQNSDIPTSKLLSKICTSYSKYFNKKYDQVGQVFQDQFKQVAVDINEYLLWLSAYIHQNPKVAGLTKNLDSYVWSSYPEFVRGDNYGFCEKNIILDQFKNGSDFVNFVESSFEIIKNKKDLEHLLLD